MAKLMNINLLCRLCLYNDDVVLYNIFKRSEENARYGCSMASRIFGCLELPVDEGDKLSPLICAACRIKVNCFFSYKVFATENNKIAKAIRARMDAIKATTNPDDVNVDEPSILLYDTEPASGTNDVDPLALPGDINENHKLNGSFNSSVFMPKEMDNSLHKVCRPPEPSKFVSPLQSPKKISKTGIPLLYKEMPLNRVDLSTLMESRGLPTEGYFVILQNGTFACKVCNKVFNYKSSLKRHFATHQDVKPFQCKVCDEEFTDYSNLFKHIRCMHVCDRLVICKYCKKEFKNSKYLKLHLQKMHKRKYKGPYNETNEAEEAASCSLLNPTSTIIAPSTVTSSELACDICQYQCNNVDELANHKITHCTTSSPTSTVSAPTNEYTCDICLYQCIDEIELADHKITHGLSSTVVAPATVTGPEYICHICPYQCSTIDELANHEITHNQPSIAVDEVTLEGDIADNNDADSVLEISMDNTSAVVSGTRDLSIDHKIICQTCHTGFPDDESLNVHTKAAHSRPTKFQCPHCPEGFLLKKKYEKHVKVVHGTNSYSCGVCSSAFPTELACSEHQESHSSRRRARSQLTQDNQQCEMCQDNFPNCFYLVLHREKCTGLFRNQNVRKQLKVVQKH